MYIRKYYQLQLSVVFIEIDWWRRGNKFRLILISNDRGVTSFFMLIHQNNHYTDVIISAMASQITGVCIVYSTVCSGANQTKHRILPVTGLCEGNPPVTGGFPSQRASNAENIFIWWRHHERQRPSGFPSQSLRQPCAFQCCKGY